MSLVFASRKGKKMPMMIKPRKYKRAMDSIRNFAPLRDFSLNLDDRRIRLSAISKIIDFSESLEKEGSGYEKETNCLKKILEEISSNGKNMQKLYLISDIVNNINFRPNMIYHIHSIISQNKGSFESLRMLNFSLLHKVFYERMFNLCAKVALDEKLGNRENMVETLQSISSNGNFDERTMAFAEMIFEKSEPNNLYWNIYALNKMNIANFSSEIIDQLMIIYKEPSFCDLHWYIELVNGLMDNRHFSKYWISGDNFSDLNSISRAITRNVPKSRILEPFLSLKKFLSESRDADSRIGAIMAEIEAIDSEPELIGFFKSLK
jgi:hypothetical protein